MIPLEQIDYNGQPARLRAEPGEVVNYVENHDNQTLFDINAYKLPPSTSREDRARVQILGAAINAFSQGVTYFHAGIDTLRSKSMDRNSYNSGDWFNRLDWTYSDNYFGTGLPPAGQNGDNWGSSAAADQCRHQADVHRHRLDARRLPRPAEDPLELDAVPAAHRRRRQGAPDVPQRPGSAQVPTVTGRPPGRVGYAGRRLQRGAVPGQRRQGGACAAARSDVASAGRCTRCIERLEPPTGERPTRPAMTRRQAASPCRGGPR